MNPITVHYAIGPRAGGLVLSYGAEGHDESVDLTPVSHEGSLATFALEPNGAFDGGERLRLAFRHDGTQESQVCFLNPSSASSEVWCRPDRPLCYDLEPCAPESEWASEFLGRLQYPDGLYVPASGGLSGLGANVLIEGGTQFGLFHPTAARVYLAGDFNDWQGPGGDPEKVIELKLYRGWWDQPNHWLVVVPHAQATDEYQFIVHGGTGGGQRWQTDPYARRLGEERIENAVILDPSGFTWHDQSWRTPPTHDLILYEMAVHGFTSDGDDAKPQDRGTYRGVVDYLEHAYFENLGVNTLALMPLVETGDDPGPQSLGYDPVLWHPVDISIGTPDDLRHLVDSAHRHGCAVLLDVIFSHLKNEPNFLWNAILDDPADEGSGGRYFSGETPWGNRVATEHEEVQNLLIDACKMWVVEYHVDGFRFDAIHSDWVSHDFIHRLARELRELKEDIVLVAENLPNEADLNLEGYNGLSQWNGEFHHQVLALVREGPYMDVQPDANQLPVIFYFCKQTFAAHSNNVVNYTWSHDEGSPAHEVATSEHLGEGPVQDRKGRLALFASMTAIGTPMLYMGQEFNVVRPRNVAEIPWPDEPDGHPFYEWSRRLIRLRRRYPALRLHGFDPAADGQFEWVIGPHLGETQGAGRKVIGWRAMPTDDPREEMVILLSFEPGDVSLDIPFGRDGVWVCLASIDDVNDLPEEGDNGPDSDTALRIEGGWCHGFTLPSSSGFIYKWEQG